MDRWECRRRRPRRNLWPNVSRHDTSFLHQRLQEARPLELHAHVSRVACCAVITGAPSFRGRYRNQPLCIVSGDAVGNLSIFYLSIPDVCCKMDRDDDSAQRLRIRPSIRFRMAHRSSINCMHYMEGTSLLLTGGDDGAVRLWNLREESIIDSKLQCVQEFLFHSSCVLACDVDPSQTFVATTGLDGIVALWLFGANIPLLTIEVKEPCFDVAILRTDPSLIQVSLKDRVSVRDIRTQPHYLHFQRALTAQVHKRFNRTASGVSLELLQRVFIEDNPLSWIRGFSSTEMCLLSMNIAETLPCKTRTPHYDEVTRRYVNPFKPHGSTSRLLRARAIHEGRTILTSASDFTHKLWNAHTRKGIASFELPSQQDETDISDSTTSLLVAPGLLCHQHRFLYGADAVGNVFVWDVRNAITSLEHVGNTVIRPTHCIHGHAFFVTSVALSHDDTVLVTGDASGKLHVRIGM